MGDRFWTLSNAIMLLLFLFAAAVQFNDPDPAVWIGIYGIAAVVCVLEIRRRTRVWMPVAVALIALIWAGTLYYGARDVPVMSLFAEWEMRDVHVEEAREMYGLAIVAAWMTVIAIVKWTRATRRRSA